MGFYGLVFPAYVWLCMMPAAGSRPTRRMVGAFAVAVIAAVPFFFVGFVGDVPWALLPGLLIVLLMRLFVGARPACQPGGSVDATDGRAD
jgi:predicted branched-subunit amino acid permease